MGLAVTLLGLGPSILAPGYDPAFVMAALGVLLVGYAVRIGQVLLRPRAGLAIPGGRPD
jgi:hypothetical protein